MVLETVELEPEFCRWISILYQSATKVVQMKPKSIGVICDQAIDPVEFPERSPASSVAHSEGF